MICSIQHIKEVVFFILALTIRVAEHEAETCIMYAVAILFQTNLSIIIEGFFCIVVET